MVSPGTGLPPLISLMKAQFTAAKGWWQVSLVLRALIGVMGVVGASIPEPGLVKALSILATTTSVVAYISQLFFESGNSLAERARRLIIFSEGWGQAISPSVEASL